MTTFLAQELTYNINPTDVNFDSRQIIPWGVKKINAPKLWSTTKAEKVKVAIFDSGIDKSHNDLINKVVFEYNAINPDEPIADKFGHGTAIAGIIAAENNEYGIVGVSPNVKLYSIKILDEYGLGTVEDVVIGIERSIENDIQIINMSFGISMDKPILREAVIKAYDAGIVIVAAVGNTYGGNVAYPAAYEEVIAVTAVDQHNNIAKYASKGKVDFAAPGVDILTTLEGNTYDIRTGTSFAAAHVTGVIALILENKEIYNLGTRDRSIHAKVNEIVKLDK